MFFETAHLGHLFGQNLLDQPVDGVERNSVCDCLLEERRRSPSEHWVHWHLGAPLDNNTPPSHILEVANDIETFLHSSKLMRLI